MLPTLIQSQLTSHSSSVLTYPIEASANALNVANETWAVENVDHDEPKNTTPKKPKNVAPKTPKYPELSGLKLPQGVKLPKVFAAPSR
jgi:hypothetical protein